MLIIIGPNKTCTVKPSQKRTLLKLTKLVSSKESMEGEDTQKSNLILNMEAILKKYYNWCLEVHNANNLAIIQSLGYKWIN